MCYYGLTSAAATLTPDLYLNFTLVLLVEVGGRVEVREPQIPAHFALLLVLDRWGRRPVLGIAQVLPALHPSGRQVVAGVTCVAAGLLSSEPGLRWLQVPGTLSPPSPAIRSPWRFWASSGPRPGDRPLVWSLDTVSSFAVVFVYTAEMFPTEIRSTAVGASSLCGRIGGILAPQVGPRTALHCTGRWRPWARPGLRCPSS
jgi:MFS family permease